MRQELVIKSKSLAGTSDLTLLAPIKKGLVPSLESLTYKTRIKRLLQALHTGRGALQEYALLRPFSDAVERVGRIHSVRVTVLEPEDKVLLAVTFDGTWESYIRVLWQKVGPLLDIIFFDTEDYAPAYDGRFEEWEAWARRVQVETNFFYGTPFLTVDDVKLLRAEERLHRENPESRVADLQAAGQRAPTAEETAWQVAANTSAQASLETYKQGLEALSALYRLTDLYLPDTEDGQFLQRAVHDLLLEFVRLRRDNEIPTDVAQLALLRFERQLAWLDRPLLPPRNPRRVAPPLPPAAPEFDLADVQGGIVEQYQGALQGALLLLGIEDRRRALPFFDQLMHDVSRAGVGGPKPGHAVLNVAFSHEGLRAAGLTEEELALFPEEFRQGMEARASVLGDMRGNHPRRWNLPRRWNGQGEDSARIELSSVHLVLTVRVSGAAAGQPDPLQAEITRWQQCAAAHGMRLLAVQTMQRYQNEAGAMEEHFGFADGASDPSVKPVKATIYPNQVHLGELLLGYANEADWPPEPELRRDPALERRRLGWLKNGSFLVVRKLAQDRRRLEELLDEGEAKTKLPRKTLLAKMMGRDRAGVPLALAGKKLPAEYNDYDYSHDPDGQLCPLHAHVRRANPRKTAQELNQPLGRRTPRIARRGMPYGPRYTPETADQERGLVFMAYNASIAEQFEAIQGWLAGGNSAGGYSGESDPFLGVPENGCRRYFRFVQKEEGEEKGQVHSIALDGSDEPLGERRPLVRLEWGSYLFTPSMAVLRRLRDRIAQAVDAPEVVWSADEGEKLIAQLQARCAGLPEAAAVALWKAALEDPVELEKFRAAGIWAAIRERHGGVLRTPYGVLVGERELVLQVLRDERVYSVRGYHDRLAGSIGDIYLGQDSDAHEKLAKVTNAEIQKLEPGPAFELARRLTHQALDEFIAVAQAAPNPAQPDRWELIIEVREVIEKLLGRLCWWWFGMPEKDTADVKLGGARWDADPGCALYPGHFTAPSRYVFQPWPGEAAQRYGRDYGRTLTAAFTRFARATTDAKGWPLKDPDGHPAPVAGVIWEQFKTAQDGAPDHEAIAQMLVGVMMGMLPTVDGNLRRSINEWLFEGTFWTLRNAWQPRAENQRGYTDALQCLARPLRHAMQLRPSPEVVWRTAQQAASLGGVMVQPGERVVASLASASQQGLAQGDADVSLVFGGDRSQPGHPPHACPAFGAAMGVLLGFAAALLERPEPMRPAAVPLALVFDGPMDGVRPHALPEPGPAGPATRSAALARRLQADPPEWLPPAPRQKPLLLGLGDSWFDYFALDVFDRLEEVQGFEVKSLAQAGTRLAQMLDDPAQLLALDSELRRRRRLPAALLLSIGGNDVVDKSLASLLLPADPAQPDRVRWKPGAIEHQVRETMAPQLRQLLDGLFALIEHLAPGARVPLLLHGYAHPWPDGRGLLGTGWKAWLQPAFEERGYVFGPGTVAAMAELIDALNQMQREVAQAWPGRVHHVDLRPVLPTHEDDYRQWWGNELHPSAEGFARLAQQLRQALGELGIEPLPSPLFG